MKKLLIYVNKKEFFEQEIHNYMIECNDKIEIIYSINISFIIKDGIKIFNNNQLIYPDNYCGVYFPILTSMMTIKLFEEAGFNTLPTSENVLYRNKTYQYMKCAKNDINIPITTNDNIGIFPLIKKPSIDSLGIG